MPAVSKKQKRLMDAAAHNPAFAKKVGIPTSVAKDFSESSKGKKFRKGGDAMKNSGTKAYAKGGMAMSGVPKKGQISASGADTAGPTATVLSQPVKKSVTGDRVQVRGVGAARARSARIY
jgi:hypothetical protein